MIDTADISSALAMIISLFFNNLYNDLQKYRVSMLSKEGYCYEKS